MKNSLRILVLVALGTLAADQVTKYLAVARLTDALDGRTGLSRVAGYFSEQNLDNHPSEGATRYYASRPYRFIEDYWHFRYVENPGAAWGMFRNLSPNVRGPLFHLVSLGAVILIGYYFTQLSGTDPKEKWALWGLSLVLGGALGNYIDRLARGFVVDFVQAHWKDQAHWPSFNVADMAICVGVGMLILDAFVRKEKPAEPAKAA